VAALAELFSFEIIQVRKFINVLKKEESSIHIDEGSLAMLNIYFYFIALHLALIKTQNIHKQRIAMSRFWKQAWK
jgi:hypothetical protein